MKYRSWFPNWVPETSLKSGIWKTSPPCSHYKLSRQHWLRSVSLMSHHIPELKLGVQVRWEMSQYEACLLGQVWAIKLPHEFLMFHCPTLDHTHPSWKASSIASSQSGGNGICHWAPLLHSWHASVALLMVVQSFLDSSMWWWRSQRRRVWNLESWVCSQKQLALNQLFMSFLNKSA